MKAEIICQATGKTVKTYSLPGVYMSYFQKWEEALKCCPLSELSSLVEELGSESPETADLIPVPMDVDYCLPAPLVDRVLSLFAEMQADTEQPFNELEEEVRIEIAEQINKPVLKLSTIFSALAVEVLQNHYPHSHYSMRVSDE